MDPIVCLFVWQCLFVPIVCFVCLSASVVCLAVNSVRREHELDQQLLQGLAKRQYTINMGSSSSEGTHLVAKDALVGLQKQKQTNIARLGSKVKNRQTL